MKALLLVLSLAVLVGAGCGGPPCVKSHQVQQHDDSSMSMMPFPDGHGGVHMIPQFRPARDYYVTVCDEYAPETK